jgi:hypothetical protein
MSFPFKLLLSNTPVAASRPSVGCFVSLPVLTRISPSLPFGVPPVYPVLRKRFEQQLERNVGQVCANGGVTNANSELS